MTEKKIFVCDDDEGIIEMLELILESTGAKVITQMNSLLAYDIILRERPDVVILDLWMPVLSGDQILRRLRLDPNTQNVPVIVISASTDGEQIATEAGATQYLAKPFDIDRLLAIVEEQL